VAKRAAGLSTGEAASAAKLSPRQVDYWARTNLLRPSITETSGTGFHRRYDLRDVKTLAVLAAFRERGVSLQGLRRVREYVATLGVATLQDAHARLVYSPHLAREVLLARSAEEVLSVLEKPGQLVPAVFVDLARVTGDAAARVHDLTEARKQRAASKAARLANEQSAREGRERRRKGKAA
jgi:DNA-binding transcriptional MerR regulator